MAAACVVGLPDAEWGSGGGGAGGGGAGGSWRRCGRSQACTQLLLNKHPAAADKRALASMRTGKVSETAHLCWPTEYAPES